jgi:putative acetyltransferase
MIRQYIKSDYARLSEIYNSSKLDELRFESEKFELLSFGCDNKRRSMILESDIYLYCGNGTMGFTAIHGSEIRALFVCPKHRGRGVGQALLKWALTKISGDACLYVAHSNKPARALYEKDGFEVTDTFLTDYNSKPVWASKMVRSRNYKVGCYAVSGD